MRGSDEYKQRSAIDIRYKEEIAQENECKSEQTSDGGNMDENQRKPWTIRENRSMQGKVEEYTIYMKKQLNAKANTRIRSNETDHPDKHGGSRGNIESL